jgi:hypothetical protein
MPNGGSDANGSPVWTQDLSGSERTFVSAMHQLGFGRFECLLIRSGELVLDPWPPTVREWKFASDPKSHAAPMTEKFALKRQVLEFLHFVRSIDSGEIRRLDIRHGLPFTMELTAEPLTNSASGGTHPLSPTGKAVE